MVRAMSGHQEETIQQEIDLLSQQLSKNHVPKPDFSSLNQYPNSPVVPRSVTDAPNITSTTSEEDVTTLL
ncbi:hypothetical protein MMC31_008227 [Peltigera leucophlebia]|nr:hypothetical protein [Peltigera leucophlebia]